MRARCDTVEKVIQAIMSDGGLEQVRNLGIKSIGEIKQAVLCTAYASLNEKLKEEFIERMVQHNS